MTNDHQLLKISNDGRWDAKDKTIIDLKRVQFLIRKYFYNTHTHTRTHTHTHIYIYIYIYIYEKN